MKRNIRKFLALFLLALTVFISSCKNSSSLEVLSADSVLKKVNSQTIDQDMIKNWSSLENPYWENACAVSVTGGKLYLSPAEWNPVHYLFVNNGYFIGIDNDTFEGVLRFFPYNSGTADADNMKIVSPYHCKGLVKLSVSEAYAIVRNVLDSNNPSVSQIIHLSLNEGEWSWETVAEFSEEVWAFTYENDMFYIVTQNGILEVNKSGEKKEIFTFEDSVLWASMAPNSIVILNGKFYLGTVCGVFEYDVNNNTNAWYPIDYSKATIDWSVK